MTRWFYVSIVFTVLAFAVSGYVLTFAYDQLPELVPTHWNIHGETDAFTPKEKIFPTFLLLPAPHGILADDRLAAVAAAVQGGRFP